MNVTLPEKNTINIIRKCHTTLNDIGTINEKKFKNLPENVCNFLISSTPLRLRELAKMNCFGASLIKSNLDKQFGENNYILITIGRSLSSIAATVKNFGVDVKQIPLSGIRKTYFQNINIPKEDLAVLKEFLSSINLSKEDLAKNRNKKYIITDYTYYGRTLDRTYELLKREDFLGNSSNFIKMPAEKLMGEPYHTNGFARLFGFNRFKYFSEVGELPLENLKQIKKQADSNKVEEYQSNISNGLRKLFKFNVIECIVNNNYESFIPVKELEAIYNHHLSQNAIRNYIARCNSLLEQKK